MSDQDSWPDASEYGRRFAEIDRNLTRAFANAEIRFDSPETDGRVRYRLAKLAIAGEDIRRAVAILEDLYSTDSQKADALVELRQACAETADSFADIDQELIRFLNAASD
jgi:hypothetical protein